MDEQEGSLMKEWCDICKNNTSDTCIHCTNTAFGCPPTLWKKNEQSITEEWKKFYKDIQKSHNILETPIENINTDDFRKWINDIVNLRKQFDNCYEETFKYILENRR